MSRTLLFVPLLLAAGITLAEEPPTAEPTPATEAQQPAKKDAPPVAGPDAQAPKQETAAPEAAGKEAEEQAPAQTGPKMISGMSILGNQEAPKSLVIVPWKSSEIGDAIGISTMLDDSRQPIDREVFLRALNYYEIRSEREP